MSIKLITSRIFSTILMMLVTVGLVASANASYTHFAGAVNQDKSGDLNTVNKYEKHVDLQPGEFKTVTVSCGFNEYATDGSARVDHVDQGTGHLTDVKIIGSYTNGGSNWEVTFKNNATGRAQAKAFVTCIKAKTIGNNFDLDMFFGPSTPNHWNVGENYIVLHCPNGYVPVAPGYYIHSGGADIFYSEPVSSNQWKLGFRVNANGTHINTQVRCLRTYVGDIHGDSHKLVLKHKKLTVSTPAHHVKTYVVACGQKSKGIVATYKLGHGVKILGHDPQPKSRVFTLYNSNNHAKTSVIDLICLGNRTGK